MSDDAEPHTADERCNALCREVAGAVSAVFMQKDPEEE